MPPRPEGDPAPLPYLLDPADQQAGGLGIALEVALQTARMRDAGLPPHLLSRGEAAAAMYWSAAQIVTHHASNGCNLQPGDLIGTGTLSTAEETGLGSLLEISQGGKRSIELPGGEVRLPRGWRRTDALGRCHAEGAVPRIRHLHRRSDAAT
jgi:fumarylacetoacetase